MLVRITITIILILFTFSCSKDETLYKPTEKKNPYNLYSEALDEFSKNNFFLASKKFSEAELNFKNTDMAAKSAIMSAFSLYGINFYDQAEENIKRYFKTYPADKYFIYANYLLAIIYFEQISDEKKDLQPLIDANKQIDSFLKNYPNNEYSIDLKFKKDLIQNQLAAKEIYIARYYISVQKWVPAINRLKLIINKYDKTVFIEEALHRLVEIHYHLGLEEEAKKYASILGYNYNSSEWYQQSYKVLNKNYNIKDLKSKNNSKKDKSFFDKIIKMIK
tara:strand:- start:1893 stop:2723 length:831 start_codon:yes stop_codon:yes gene_type:complete